MLKHRRLIFGLLAVVLVVVVLVQYSDQGVPAVTVRAERTSLEVSIREEGRTRVGESYVVTSPTSGLIERVNWKEGDEVGEGSVLFKVLPTPDSGQSSQVSRARYEAATARQRQAQTLIDDARAVSEQAELTLKRQRSLAEQEIISAEMLEQADLAASSAVRQLEAARETLIAADADVLATKAMLITDDADRDASGSEVVAPVSGRVLRVFEQSERVVLAGTPILEMGDTELLELVVDVLSEDAVRIRSGNRVDITGWGGENSLQGRVRLVEPAAFTKISALGVEEQRVNVIIDLEDAPTQLGVGFRVEAGIVVWEADDIVTIPISSVFQEDGLWFTFIVESDTVSKRAIELGERSAEMIHVTEGLVTGEEVVRYPSVDIDDGVVIKR